VERCADQSIFYGNKLEREVVFFHRDSRTLILTDLCFNLRHIPSVMQGVQARMFGVFDRFGPSRLFRLMMNDRKAARASLERISEWDFDRVIVAHGEVLQSGGKRLWPKRLRGCDNPQ
jgi:hypothetical protein